MVNIWSRSIQWPWQQTSLSESQGLPVWLGFALGPGVVVADILAGVALMVA
jgi:hypothetical protein